MDYVGKYHSLMISIMAKAQNKTMAPQAAKMLYETGVMMQVPHQWHRILVTRHAHDCCFYVQTPPSHWSCGCEIAYTLYMKQDHTFNTVTPGPDDGAVPYVFMVCITDAQCPGAESSCMVRPVCNLKGHRLVEVG